MAANIPNRSTITEIGHPDEPTLYFSELDQIDPLGRYRIRVSGDIFYFERATAIDWATTTTLFSFSRTGGVGTGRGATYTVAASDAPAYVQAQADYVCDGTADDVQIQAANDLLTSGGIISLSIGTFTCAAQIILGTKVILEGQGFNSILSFPSGSVSGVKLNADYATIRNVTIQGKDTTSNVTGISDRGVLTTGICIQNVRVAQWFRGIYFNYQANDSFVLNNVIDTVAIGMDLWRSNGVKVANNTLVNLARDGIRFDGCTYSNISNNSISNWDTISGGFYAIILANTYGVNTGNAVIGNIIRNNINADALSSAIVVSGEANDANLVTNFVIANNAISGTIGHGLGGIYLHSFNGTYDNVRNGTIQGNTVSGFDDGFRSAWAQNITWSGNTSSFNGTNGWLLSAVSYHMLSANIARNNSQSSTNTTDGFRIQSGSVNVMMIGNVAYDDQVSPTQRYGIAEFTADCSGCRYSNNYLGLAATGTFISAGSSYKINHNSGYITENAGTGSIANAATSAVITHGLSYTPTLAEISVTLGENPSNTPGAIWVDTITSTQFTVNCENDPGASNLDFSWAIRKI